MRMHHSILFVVMIPVNVVPANDRFVLGTM
jgi:hypothetical protein